MPSLGDANPLPPRSSTAASSLHADMQQNLRDSWLAFLVFSGGGLAQLGEHYVRNVGVGGSTPLPSTKPSSLVPAAHQAEPIFIAAAG